MTPPADRAPLPPAPDPERVLAELRELHQLSASAAGGANRLAWSERFREARAWLDARLSELPVAIEVDPAGNHWATLAGRSSQALVLGSHIDSVNDGGWLDGALGVLAGLEAMRAIHARFGGDLPLTLRLVDWADEEGARFGRSLLGSSAAAGTIDLEEIRTLVDADGIAIAQAMADCGVELEQIEAAGAQLADAVAYLELHIEQGPVLERANEPLAVVEGTCGAHRVRVRLTGRVCHPAATPMADRKDALLGAARLIVAAHEIAERHGAMTSIGYCAPEPGHITIIAGACEIVIEQNHHDAELLRRVVSETLAQAHAIAEQAGLAIEVQELWRIEPLEFDPELRELIAAELSRMLGRRAARMMSGPLHDAGEVARAGVPAAMIFVRSVAGISHSPQEDSYPDDIRLAVNALHDVALRFLLSRAGHPAAAVEGVA